MAASAAKGKPLKPGRQRLRPAHRKEDLDIFLALQRIRRGGDSLALADPYLRGDRDFILEAVEYDPEAVRYVEDQALLSSPDFAFEAVCRNPWVLGYLPEVHLADRRVRVGAAAAAAALGLGLAPRQAAPALAFSGGAAEAAAVEAAAAERELPGWYDGEHLMLTGSFSSWMTADSQCRLFKLTSKSICSGSAEWPTRGEAEVPAPPRARAAVRHRLVALLPTGCLAFQLVSCAKGRRFRIFPLETYRPEPLRLACGRPSAVPAAVGGANDGGGRQFLIREEAFAVVSIYVEVLRGAPAARGPEESGRGAAGTNRGVAVWFVFEPLKVRWRGAVELCDQDAAHASAARLAPGSSATLPAVEVVARVDCGEDDLSHEHKDFIQQMCRHCRRTPEQHWEYVQAGSSGLYLAVVVERWLRRVVAFCRYDLMESANHVADERFDPKRSAFMPCAPPCLVIEHIEVLEERRGLGLGRMLVERLAVEARHFRCCAVKLISVSSSQGFYERLGFEAKYQLDNEQTWREIEPKEYSGHEVEREPPEVEEEEGSGESAGEAAAAEPHMRSWLLENQRLPVAMELKLHVKRPW